MTRVLTCITIILAGGFPHLVFAQAYPSKPIRMIVPFAEGEAPDHVSRRPVGGNGAWPPGLWHVALQRLLIALFAGASILALPAVAQSYPSKPIRLIVPFAEGEAPDHVSRRPVGGDGAWPPGFIRVAAQEIAPYPIRPIRLIVPFAPGGGSDLIARIAAQKLTETMGQPVIVDNRAGAGGTVGAELGVKAPADGYTLTLIALSYTVGPSMYKLSFDAANDITAVIQLTQGPFLIAVHPSLPVKNVRELIALAKARPGQLSYASSGTGSGTHLASELFLGMAGIRVLHIPYKGTGPALTDTIAGHVQMTWGSVSSTLSQVKAGRLRGIAVSTPWRIPSAPEIPTVTESGLKGYEVVLWHGLIAPKGLPAPVLARLNGELNAILKAKDMEERLAVDGVAPAGGTPAQFMDEIRKGIEVWGGVVRKLGVKAD